MSGEHAKFSPSQLGRLLLCPASYRESIGRVSEPSKYAEEGTYLHEVCENVLKGKKCIEDFKLKLTDEQKTTVEEAVEAVDKKLKDYGYPGNAVLEVEVKVNPEKYGMPDSWGRADVICFNPYEKTLLVGDYKFGSGVLVDAVDNPQQMAYGLGALTRFPKAESIELFIIQPRLNNYDTWTIDKETLIEWGKETGEKLKRCYETPAIYNPCTKACRWCDARFTCQARIDWLQELKDQVVAFATTKSTVPIEQLIELHKAGAMIKKAINEISAHLLAKACAGEKLPTLKLVYGKATRYWVDQEKAKEVLVERFGHKAFVAPKLCSPAQIEKLDKSIKKDPQILGLWDKKKNFKLVDESNRAKEVPPPHSNSEEFKAFD